MENKEKRKIVERIIKIVQDYYIIEGTYVGRNESGLKKELKEVIEDVK